VEPDVERARQVLGERADVAAKLAHEIRGPVTTIRGIASTALAHYEALSDDERREFLGLIRHEAERMERTVEQVALALRLDADAVRPHRRPRDLVELVREASSVPDEADHDVTIDAPAGLVASVDATLVARVVRAAVENATAFSPPGTPVTVRVARDGDHAVIQVRDRGPGIPEDRRDAVFERFTDWRPPGYEDRSGTGLGLSICRAVARLHGGDVSIAANPEGGTMLTVRLPLEG
jgi:signal transduction histidine kinase